MMRRDCLDRMKLALRDVFPLLIAYIPLSMTFGVLATANGLSPVLANFISAWIYSGGAQFMLLGMFTAAAAPATIIATILLVSMRHILYGAAMGPYLAHWKEPLKWIAACGLTDEGFVVTSNRAVNGERMMPSYYLTFAFAGYVAWMAGSIAGSSLGGMVSPELVTVLGFALPAMFLALLLGGERSLPSMMSACTGAIVATLAGMFNLGGAGLVFGALIGATAGQMLARKGLKRTELNPSRTVNPGK